MTDADFAPFATSLGIAAETLDAPISELRIRGYFDALRDLPLEQVVLALKQSMRDATWLPKPGEIRQRIEGSTDDAAALAWASVQQAIRRIGRYSSPRAALGESGYAAMLATWGDWQAACDMETEGAAVASARKSFVAAYAAQERRTQQETLLGLGSGDRAAQGRLGPSVADVAGLVKVMR